MAVPSAVDATASIDQVTEELAPTQEAKRAVVYSRFKDVIDSLYE
jgi:hypothetical protein